MNFNQFFYAGKFQYCVWLVIVISVDVNAKRRNEIDEAVKTSLLKGANSLQQQKEQLREFRMNGNTLMFRV